MTPDTAQILREDHSARARAIGHGFLSCVQSGAPWYPALLDAIARWPLPQEWVAGRYFRYLVGSEAFDWLLLAERLLEMVEDVVPEEERIALLFHATPPSPQS